MAILNPKIRLSPKFTWKVHIAFMIYVAYTFIVNKLQYSRIQFWNLCEGNKNRDKAQLIAQEMGVCKSKEKAYWNQYNSSFIEVTKEW